MNQDWAEDRDDKIRKCKRKRGENSMKEYLFKRINN